MSDRLNVTRGNGEYVPPWVATPSTSEFLDRLDALIAFAQAAPFRGHVVAVRALRQVRRAVVKRQRLNAPQRRHLSVEREAWSKQFGGGMVPFDIAYHDALRAGSTIAEAQRLGVDAALDAFIARVGGQDA